MTSDEAIQSGACTYTVCAPQRTPKVRSKIHPRAMSWVAAMEQASRAVPKRKRGRNNRPVSIGPYTRKDTGKVKLVPMK